MRYRFYTILLFCFLIAPIANGQAVYEHISNERIYNFIDEMASEKLITLNSAIKPYTRSYIYNKLKEISKVSDQLNHRQKKELEYFLDYYRFGNQEAYVPSKAKLNLFNKSNHSVTSINHLGYFFSDSLFSFCLRPILGLEYFTNASGNFKHTYGGVEAFASLTKYLSFYASLRDNTVSEILVRPGFFSKEMGGIYKGSIGVRGGADYSEMRGGVILSWDFLEIGFVKDHIAWGTNYNQAIVQSGHNPSFPMIKFHTRPTKWFDFNYYHAWLTSDVVDSSLTYLIPNGLHRETFKNKFIAANMFTITPVAGLNLSFGNSIIYSDQNVNLAYLIPVFFYKSADHTLTSNKIQNQNSQMFLDISVRLLKHTHFYLSAFWDEFSTKRVFDPERHNFYSYKIGGKLSNWPLKNLSFTSEYFRSVPLTYMHYIPTLTYESNGYNMGPWLRNNSDELFVSIDTKPLPRLFLKYSYSEARHGNNFDYIVADQFDSYPILNENTWTCTSHSILVSYEFLTNCHISLEYYSSNTKGYDVDGQTAEFYLNKYTPEFFQGKKNTAILKVNLGF